MKNALVLIACLCATGCAPGSVMNATNADASMAMVWPEPPQEPRIRFLYSLSQPGDIGIKPGIFTRFMQVFAGKDAQGMARPYAIAADDELICVVDPGLKVLHLFMPGQSKYEVIRAAGEESFQSPVGVSLGAETIFVTDSVAGKVFVFDRAGNHRRTIGGLARPTGVAYHAGSGRVYVVDTLQHGIHVFDESGSRLSGFGSRGRGPGEFNFPTFVALSGDSLLVNDTMNYRIQAMTLEGVPVSAFGEIGDGSGQFALSKGVGVDLHGHVYVADGLSNHVQIFDTDGRFLLAFGGTGSQVGWFRIPAGIHVFGNTIFVADSQNRRVQVFEYVGGAE